MRIISERVGRVLERQGLLVRELENRFLMVDLPDGAGFVLSWGIRLSTLLRAVPYLTLQSVYLADSAGVS